MNVSGSSCTPITASCLDFTSVNNEMIKLVMNYYLDLQEYANRVFLIDSNKELLSPTNNFITEIKKIQSERYRNLALLRQVDMENLQRLVGIILKKLKHNVISKNAYLSDLKNIAYFASGDVSTTILLKATRIINKREDKIIIKVVPLEYQYQYQFFQGTPDEKKIHCDIY